VHHPLVVGTDLVGPGELVVAGVGAGRVDRVLSQRYRVDPVEGRRLVEPDVRVGVLPVASRRVATIDDRDRRIRVGEQLVGDRHPGGPCPDHQVVRLELFVHGRAR